MSGSDPGTHDGESMRRSLTDPQIFRDVYQRHFRPIHAYCVTRVGLVYAEDVAQQVFLVAFVHRDEFEFDRADARPWLCGIARHLFSRHFRVRRRLEQLTIQVGPPRPITASAGEIIGRVDAQRLREPLTEALRDLPAAQRETLVLYAVEGLTHREIAVSLDIKVGTVKSRLSRAKAHIRVCWDTKTHGEPGWRGNRSLILRGDETPDGTPNGSNGST